MLRRRYYSLRGLQEKLMRPVMIAALSALAALATISVAYAQNDQKVSRPHLQQVTNLLTPLWETTRASLCSRKTQSHTLHAGKLKDG